MRGHEEKVFPKMKDALLARETNRRINFGAKSFGMSFRSATVSSSGVPVHIIFFSNTELSWSAPQ